MVKYSVPLTILLTLPAVQSFAGSRIPALTLQRELAYLKSKNSLTRDSTTTLHDVSLAGDNEEDSNSLSGIAKNIDVADMAAPYLKSLSNIVSPDEQEDVYETEMALKKKIAEERSGNYEITMPLQLVEGGKFGLSLCQVDSGEFSKMDLNLDTYLLQSRQKELSVKDADTTDENNTALHSIYDTAIGKALPKNLKGVLVSEVLQDGWAWNQGIRPGDYLKATSATLGDKMWPKSTLEGVRSSLASRKIVSGSLNVQFQRINVEEIGEQFELTLTRPLGIEIEETKDGYVQVSGLTENAPKLVQYGVQPGDRILSIDSFSGNMWPVSTADGLVSAISSRLPGQSVTMRFARPRANMRTRTEPITSISDVSMGAGTLEPLTTKITATSVAKQTTVTSSTSHKALLRRCRDVLYRYMSEAESHERSTFSDKYAVPAIVADRVLESLASASASLDSKTLAVIMNAYLSCRKPEGAIRAFEAAIGTKGDGSAAPITDIIKGKDGDENQIIPNNAALNLYTATSLIRAHALTGDIHSATRVMASLEGHNGVNVNGIHSVAWSRTESLRLDTKCYNIAMAAAAKLGGEEGSEMALDLFNKMSDSKLSRDVVSFNTVIGALAKEGRYEDASAVFDSMNKAAIKPDKFTYTSLIKACARDGNIQELLSDMKEKGIQPDVLTYNTMIKVLCNRYQWFEAKKLITDMESSGIVPNSMTYGLLMDGLLKADKPAACLMLFESACSDSRTAALTENIYLYTTAITATSALANHEGALDLVARMSAAGIKPNIKTLTALMGACLSSGKAQLAVDVFKKIDKPDGFATTQGLRALCEAHDLNAASKLLSRYRNGRAIMSGKEVMASYNTLIRSALMQKDYAMAKATLTELIKSRYIPSKIIYQSIIEALNLGPRKRNANVQLEPVPEESFQFLLFVLDTVHKRNLPFDGSFYASVLFCGARMGGVNRKISSLLSEARAQDVGDLKSHILLDTCDVSEPDKCTITWEQLLLNYDVYKKELGKEVQLPLISVRIGNKNIRYVLSAEQAVTHNSARRSMRMSKFTNERSNTSEMTKNILSAN